ncbi:MAG: SMC-Scp complex subunit ScpB, partial [Firmicutes bacterium]|nr:SMC-Scp complex subunit ScpB [Bacillota bacterium]
DRAVVKDAVEELRERHSKPDSGIEIQEVAGGIRLVTKPHLSEYVERLVRSRPPALSRAALETLAIVAYRQPVTRAQIEMIRGVKSESALNTLLERRLVREVGRKPVLGRPMLYGTTREFLKEFGLNSIEDLPEARLPGETEYPAASVEE